MPTPRSTFDLRTLADCVNERLLDSRGHECLSACTFQPYSVDRHRPRRDVVHGRRASSCLGGALHARLAIAVDACWSWEIFAPDQGCYVWSELDALTQSKPVPEEDLGTHNYVRMGNRTVAHVSEKEVKFRLMLLFFALPSSLLLACCLVSHRAEGIGLMYSGYRLTFRTIRQHLEHFEQTQRWRPGAVDQKSNTRCTCWLSRVVVRHRKFIISPSMKWCKS